MSTLTCDIGLPVTWDVTLTRAGVALTLPTGTQAWFTVKAAPTDAALIALSTATGEGITFLDRDAGALRLRATAEQTAALSDLVEYYAELLYQRPGEDPDLPDQGRARLTARAVLHED